jgi:hypothetical protein
MYIAPQIWLSCLILFGMCSNMNFVNIYLPWFFSASSLFPTSNRLETPQGYVTYSIILPTCTATTVFKAMCMYCGRGFGYDSNLLSKSLFNYMSRFQFSTSPPLGLVSYESVLTQELTTSLCNLLAVVHPEDGGDTILRNVGSYKSHTVSSPRW